MTSTQKEGMQYQYTILEIDNFDSNQLLLGNIIIYDNLHTAKDTP
jgi:hypothetical protein